MQVRKTFLVLALVLFLIVGGNVFLYYVTVLSPSQALLAAQQATQEIHLRATNTARADANLVSTAAVEAMTATAIGQHNFYTQSTSGSPALNDSLSKQDDLRWDEGTSSNSMKQSCIFSGGMYHVLAHTSQGRDTFCLAHGTRFNNFAFQVQIASIKGGDYNSDQYIDSIGIIFRADDTLKEYYDLIIDYTHLVSERTCGLTRAPELTYTAGISCSDAPLQPSLLTVIAYNSYIYMFVNERYMARFKDNSYSSGEIGMYVSNNYGANDIDVAFSNARVWRL